MDRRALPQPDALAIVEPSHGGLVVVSEDGREILTRLSKELTVTD